MTSDTSETPRAQPGSPDGVGRADPRMLALLIDQVSDYAIFLLDPHGNVASWNPGAQKIKGYRAEEIIGRHFSKFYPPETRTADWPQRELELAQRYGRFEDEGWRLRKDGSRFWANVVITTLRDAEGVLTGFAKITRDLTERRNQEERLRRSEARYRLLIEGVKDSAIVILSPAGLVQTWNAGAQRIFGYASHEIIGRDSECFFLPDDLQRGAPYRELEEAAHQRAETEGWRVRRDGTHFWAHVITTPEYDRDGLLTGYTQVLRDMTESRRMDALEEAGRRTNEFIAMLAHELRNPLAPIRNAVAVMQTGEGALPAMEPWLRIIDRQTSQLSRLLDDLLDASRVANGKITVQRQRVDLRSVLARALEASRPLIDAHRHQIEIQVSAEPLPMDGDAARLCQVFANLLDNAAKYTLDGGKLILSAKRVDSHAVVRVRDNGIGMSAAMRERAFDLFVQGERALDRAGGGLGIGLPLARRVIELHDGEIRAESSGVRNGTQIVVRLPLLREADDVTEDARGATPDTADLPSLRILVVDDNEDSAETLSVLLRLWGHEVWAASSGDEAVRLARQVRPAAIILDIGLPGMDGYETARQLRRMTATRNARLVALTGYSQPEDRLRSLAAGFDEHLIKPVDCEQLLQALRSARARTPKSIVGSAYGVHARGTRGARGGLPVPPARGRAAANRGAPSRKH